MIVVSIIGILAAVALPSYRDYIVQSQGGAAMKGMATYSSKSVTCVQSGIGCDGVAADIASTPELSITGGPLGDGVGATLAWDNGKCVVSALISNNGLLSYSAAKSVGSSATSEQCRAGAGL
ncbi:general secretion pathway protein [Spongiibacter sp. KMU-158]|uniref:General secretion pathway protein n=1 Tax=Spongiibacter pelagi TaxID=2760804 RepID=A0A927GWH7_9GAMM|nr:general secretion pathway protein [Spongiibacter pelagi]